MNRRHFIGLSATGMLALSGCLALGADLDETEHLEDRWEAPEVTTISLETITGDITVTGEDRGDIELQAEKAAADADDLAEAHLERELRDGTLTIRADPADTGPSIFGFTLGPTPRIDLTLRVPRGLRIESVHTTTGRVELTSIQGPTTVETTTGDVSVDGLDGNLDLEVTTGDVTIASVIGRVVAETTTGDLDVESVDGDVDAETTTGDVRVAEVTGDVEVSTTTGDVSTEAIDGNITVD